MNLSSKSLIATILVVVSLVLAYFVVYPRYKSYTQARASEASAQAQQDGLKAAQKQLNDFLADYKSHADAATQLNEALPLSKNQMANLLNNMDSLTKSAGLTLGPLDIVDTPDSDTLGAIPNSIQTVDLSISGSGTFPEFKDFLTKLEASLRIMDINTISIQSDQTQLKFNMSFKSYYQK